MTPSESRPVTTHDFSRWKAQGRKATALTAYDYPMAKLLDEAGVDCLLVGDSLGTVVQGHATTLSVTLDQMIYHGEMVARAARRSLVVVDLPFMTYQVSPEQAAQSAGQIMQQTSCGAVKLEGGLAMARTIEKLVQIGIPVMGHLGLTPQSVHQLGGYRVQRDGQRLLEDARAISDAGAFAIVLECVPCELADQVTEKVSTPTIGIGAGSGCDGQILVTPDLLGFHQGKSPKFVRQYFETSSIFQDCISRFIQDVQHGRFPSAEESYT